MERWINRIGLLFVLMDNFFLISLESVDFRAQYILYLLFILYHSVTHKLLVNKRYLFNIIFIVFILGLVPLLKGSGFNYFIKQLLLITLHVSFAYVLINAYKYDFERLFKDYIQLIYIASLVGVLQGVSLALNFLYGADYSYLGFEMGNFGLGYTRIQSWFEEPSFLALAFMPVIFISVAKFFKLTELISFWKAVFITIMFLLTQSSVGLMGILLSIIIIVTSKYSVFGKPHYVTFGIILLCFIGYGFYSIPLVNTRTDDTLKLFFDNRVSGTDIDNSNLSTYALYSNYKVTQASFVDNPIFGTGLGSHELNYKKYIHEVVPPSNFRKEWQLNKKDANSLLLRIISECGLFGLALLIWFLVDNRVKLNLKNQNKTQITYWVINNSVLVLIVVRLIRQGHYTLLGLMVFAFVYFYTKKHYKILSDEVKL